jgi:hypothetical protein
LCLHRRSREPFQPHRIVPVASNWNGNAPDVTSPEIIDATDDGLTLVYTDSPGGVIGAIDITDPTHLRGLGVMALEGEPNAPRSSASTT